MPETTDTLNAIAYGDAPVLEALTEIMLDTLERSGLDLKTYYLVRIAGLVAMDAPPVSYAVSVEEAIDFLEWHDLEGVLVALAPVVGSARIAAAASNMLDVFSEDDSPLVGAADDTTEELTSTPAPRASSEYFAPATDDEPYWGEDQELEAI